jgi:hypothetical protein
MRSRLLRLCLVLVFVVMSLGVGVRPAAAAGTVTATCNSIDVSGTTLTPGFPVSVLFLSPSGIPPIFTLSNFTTGAYTASTPHTLPVGTVVSGIMSDGFAPQAFTVTIPACGAGGGATWNPGDARVDPRPGDRVAVYCNIDPNGPNPNTIGVYGILDDGTGKFLTAFKVSDIVKAGGRGITRSVEPLGTVIISVSGGNSFYVKWLGGPADATGQGDFRKRFTCDFGA